MIPRTKGLVSSRRKLKRDGDERRKEWAGEGERELEGAKKEFATMVFVVLF